MSLGEFRKNLEKKYLFHIHTNYTDGQLTVKDYFEFANKNNITTLIFTEHVRKNLNYNFLSFVQEIKSLHNEYSNINYIIGVEAKILPDGDLDIDRSILSYIDLICFASHAFPNDISLFYNSYKNLFFDSKWKNYIRIWVHPGRFFKKNGILDKNIELLSELIDLAIFQNIFIEKNLQDKVPPEKIKINERWLIKGYDIHTKKQLDFTLI